MTDTNDSLIKARSRDDASPGPGAQTVFSFATWNILHGRVLQGRVDSLALANSVRSLEADVVALQEVDRHMLRSGRVDQAARLASVLGVQHIFGPARRRWDSGSFGNALLARHPMQACKTLRLARDGWRRERRAAVLADVALGGCWWRVGTAHLSLYRDESEAQLRQLLHCLDAATGPAVLLGDFNRRPNEVVPLAEALGWTVVETANTFRADDPQLRLDYVLIKRCSALDVKVRQLAVSDHRAVTVTLRADD